MKKMIFVSLLIVLPLLLLAARPDPARLSRKLATAFGAAERGGYRPTQIVSNMPDGSNWLPYEKYELDYGTQLTMPDSVSVFEYDADGQAWVKLGVVRYLYNAQGNISSSVMYINTGAEFIPLSRTQSLYNAPGWVTHMQIETRDFVNELWVPTMRFHVFYDDAQIQNVYTWASELESRPGNYSKLSFLFDGEGRIIEETDQVSADSTNWLNDFRITRSYLPQDTSTGWSYIWYMSRYLPMMFVLDDLSILNPSKPLFETGFEWMGNTWMEIERDNYSYNAEYLCTQDLYSFWDVDHWQDGMRWNFLYYDYDEVFQRFEWEWDGLLNDWVNTDMDQYYWEFVDVAADDPAIPAPGRLSLYPSPFGGELKISLDGGSGSRSVQVFNLKGQLLREWTAPAGQTTAWDGRDSSGKEVPAGVYLVKAGSGAGASLGKCLKLK